MVNREPGEAVTGDPLLEYFLEVTMPDGQTHEATAWMPSDKLRVLIGEYQIKQALGYLPSIAEAKPEN
ncbi:MAG: hypothetical protein GKR87_00785 [Kiritimatiellae bacterium]|nr:hypothetical protein [Kiritimatiellia bacterium]